MYAVTRVFIDIFALSVVYVATGYTAPEIVASRADATKNNMGFTAFKGVKVRKTDVTVAKNYMTEEEINTLNLIVNMYLDYAELQAKQHNALHMADWEEKLNQFLRFNGREVLQNFGSVKREVADALALEQFEKYDAHRRMIESSDTDVDLLVDDAKKLNGWCYKLIIILCKDKNNAVVEMTLPEDNSQIFASKYETVLPSKEDLKKLLEEQMGEENNS